MKLCRREGMNLFGTEKYNLADNHRKPLGGRFGKSSGYSQQLRKKQAAKRMFGLSEKQFSAYFEKAQRSGKIVGDTMMQYLEQRLDTVVYKSNFARTQMQARQFVAHAHFLVNGKKVNIPSYQIKVGDVITLKERMKESPIYKSLTEEFAEFKKANAQGTITKAQWITVDTNKLSITIDRLPDRQDFDQSIDIGKIVEFYTR
jgi:small subunit ribosomal protein S4